MQLKEALEAATDDIDVRPGFVGDVLHGARRRRTRNLTVMTAVIALVIGVAAGMALTRPDNPGTDPRFGMPTAGGLAQDLGFLSLATRVWHAARTEGDGPVHVYWAGRTQVGATAIVLQEIRVPEGEGWTTAVGVVAPETPDRYTVAAHEVATERGGQQGVFRIGRDLRTYLVLERGVPVNYSSRADRAPNGTLSRQWRQLTMDGGVSVVETAQGDNPVFVAGETAPRPDDFNAPRLNPTPAPVASSAQFTGGPELGWLGARKVGRPIADNDPLRHTYQLLQDRRLIDYAESGGFWCVAAGLPDGRTVVVTDINMRLVTIFYHGNGQFDRIAIGHPLVKGKPLPVRVPLPDGQGTVLADWGTRIGPAAQIDAWLAPTGTTEVSVDRYGTVTQVPLA